jgi:hypothetical protein
LSCIPTSFAGKWLRENDGNPRFKRGRPKAKPFKGKFPREHVAGHRMESIRSFVEHNRGHRGGECLFVPGAQPGQAAAINRFGKTVSAARYMAILTLGVPKSEGVVVRHLCGNGHLSCVNPEHLAWGDAADNASDARKHQRVGDTPQERMAAL